MTRRMTLVLLALLAVLGAVGCGVSGDSQPQAIPADNLPPDLLDPNPGSSTTLPESAGTTTVTVYFLEQVGDAQRLVGVPREVADPSSPGDRIAALLSQPTEEEATAGLDTAIPADTTVVGSPEPGDMPRELVVDLSSDLLSIQGEQLAKAFAQIVWTLTEPGAGGYRQVRFLQDGEPTSVVDAEGALKEGAVSRADYRAFTPR